MRFFIGKQKSFCSSYTAHGNLSILHSYSFQVPLIFLRKVITRRVCVICTLWVRSMTNDATAEGAVSVPKLGKSMILTIPVRTVWQTILLLGVFCDTPTWKFSKRNTHSYYTYSLCFWDKDSSPEGCETFTKVGHDCWYIHTWPTGWSWHFQHSKVDISIKRHW